MKEEGMTREERNNKLKHFITCMKCEVSGKCCDENCPIQYDAGNMGEIIENLEEISKILEREPCEDAVSRKVVLDMMQMRMGAKELYKAVYDLPSVTPARKKGKWIDTDATILNRQGYLVHEVICSECNSISYFRTMGNKYIGANYCPNCGTKMEK